MEKYKITYMGKPVKARHYSHRKDGTFAPAQPVRSFIRRALAHLKWMGKTFSFIFVFSAFVAFAGTFTMWSDPITVDLPFVLHAAAKEEAPKPYTLAQAIADCESGTRKADGSAVHWSARQFDKNGQVVKNVNKTGQYIFTVDVGYMGINVDINGKEAGKNGYNVYTEEGNMEFGQWLLKKEGTAPWNSSKSCWSKAKIEN